MMPTNIDRLERIRANPTIELECLVCVSGELNRSSDSRCTQKPLAAASQPAIQRH